MLSFHRAGSVLAVAITLLTVGCSSPSKRRAMAWQPLDTPGEVVRLDRDLPKELGDSSLSNAFGLEPRPRRGSKWRAVGAIEDATVYEPVDAQFLVTVYHGMGTKKSTFGGALAVSENSELVGYYVPLGQFLLPIEPPFAIQLVPRP